jgi:hypothetical protein
VMMLSRSAGSGTPTGSRAMNMPPSVPHVPSVGKPRDDV